MRLSATFLAALTLPLAVLAQDVNLGWKPISGKHEIHMGGDFYYNSTVITNEFVRAFYTGKFIDDELKGSIAENLRTENRFGSELHYGIEYIFRPDSLFGTDNWSLVFGVSNHLYNNFSFTEDLFTTAFYGNAGFEDEIAQLGPMSFNSLAYQKLSFGVMDNHTGSSINLGLINGQQMNVIDVSKAELYTAPLGEWIELNLAADWQQSDTAASGLGTFSGMGACLGFDWKFELGGSARDFGFYSLSLSDFGFIAWNSNSRNYSNDTTYNYQGFEIDLNNPTINTGSLEDTVALNYSYGSMVTMLPFKMALEKITHFNEGNRIQSVFGVDHRFGMNYVPRAFVGLAYLPSENLEVSAALAYGGYGGAQIEIKAGGTFAKRFKWKLGSHNLVDSLLPKGTGTSLFAKLGVVF